MKRPISLPWASQKSLYLLSDGPYYKRELACGIRESGSAFTLQYAYLASTSPPPTLNLETNSSENCKLWKEMWYVYLIVSGLDLKPDHYVTALMIHSIGKDALRIYNGMQVDDEDRNNSAKTSTSLMNMFWEKKGVL